MNGQFAKGNVMTHLNEFRRNVLTLNHAILLKNFVSRLEIEMIWPCVLMFTYRVLSFIHDQKFLHSSLYNMSSAAILCRIMANIRM